MGRTWRRSKGYRALHEVLERRLLVSTLVLHGWDRSAAAQALCLTVSELRARCRYYGLSNLQARQPVPPPTIIRSQSPPPRRRHGSDTKLRTWAELPPPSPQAFPFSVYVERERIISRMLGEGATYAQIGTRLGLTRERVRQLCHRFGLDHYTGRRVRAGQNERRQMDRRRKSLLPRVASVVEWLEAKGVEVEPVTRRKFKVGDEVFCVHTTQTARQTSPSGYLRYYHFRATCRSPTTYIVCVTGEGRRFVIPQSQWAESLYIPQDDGAWASYRDRWPMFESVRTA